MDIEDINKDNGISMDEQVLNLAFDKFNESSDRIIQVYTQLKKRVDSLDKEMETKNKELNNKVNELYRLTQYKDSILESMHSGVVAVDIDGHVTTLNKAAQLILNIRKEEAIGKWCESVMKSSDKHSSLLREAIEKGQEFPNVKMEVLRPDNTTIWIETSVALLREKDGRIIGAVEIFKDLSEIKLLEERLEKADRLSSIGEMTASIAHEIRNPLNGIRGFASLLEKDFSNNDPRKKFVRRIIDGVENLNDMVTDFLVLAKPVKPILKINNLVCIIDEVISFIYQDLKTAKNRINIERYYNSKPTMLTCDRHLLYQAFYNLVQNSFQAIPGDGTISIGINNGRLDDRMSANGEVEVFISDNGIGINELDQSRIFEPFFTTKSEGTGLGLSLVQKIIKLHKGEIKFESVPGKGTTFHVYLPRINGTL